MNRALNWTGQALLYGSFALALGLFSRWPVYHPLAADMAQIKVSFIHHGARLAECRAYTAEEQAKMAPNMRRSMQCGRERAPVHIEMDIDGQPVINQSVAPAGLSRDGASTFYRRLDVTAGEHRIAVRFKDSPKADATTYQFDQTVQLRPAQVLVIDFNPDKGGIALQ
ncbi:hypothetical protein MASR1M59_10580 [Melaminivora sp.]